MNALRLIGAIGLVLCGWCTGDAVCQKSLEHLTALEETLELLRELRQEIGFRRADLSELCAALVRAGRLDAPEKCLQTARPPQALARSEAECFRECVSGMGRAEAERECARLDLYIRKFAVFLQQCRADNAERRRLARRLGAAAGLSAAILLL